MEQIRRPPTLRELPGARLIGGAWVRTALAGLWLMWAIAARETTPWMWPAAALFLVFALGTVETTRRNLAPRPRTLIILAVDMTVITLAVYWNGSVSTMMVGFFLPMVAAHSLDRVRGTSAIALALFLIEYPAIVLLETFGALPARPGGAAALGGDVAAVGLAVWPIVVATIGVFFILNAAVRRIDAFVDYERTLRQQENEAQERARKLEARLLESHRLESLGRLAGGVAHDFNNLLTGIIGLVGLTHDDLPVGDSRRADLAEAVRSAQRAGELTKQLLAIGREQMIEVREVDLNAVVTPLERMLSRILGEQIALTLELASLPIKIKADTSQLEQIVVNLAVNARDAMHDGGGDLTITTANTTLDNQRAQELGDIGAGTYATLTVADTGAGMNAETRERIFEPFFTTKDRDKGTGLGLATVYGIVKQNRGAIEVESEPGRGTRFTVYWPMSPARTAQV